MAEVIKITQDNSTDIYLYGSDDVSILDPNEWSAKFYIGNPKEEDPTKRVILSSDLAFSEEGVKGLPANSYFVWQLNPTATKSLPIGKYVMIIEAERVVDNEVVFKKEIFEYQLVVSAKTFTTA